MVAVGETETEVPSPIIGYWLSAIKSISIFTLLPVLQSKRQPVTFELVHNECVLISIAMVCPAPPVTKFVEPTLWLAFAAE